MTDAPSLRGALEASPSGDDDDRGGGRRGRGGGAHDDAVTVGQRWRGNARPVTLVEPLMANVGAAAPLGVTVSEVAVTPPAGPSTTIGSWIEASGVCRSGRRVTSEGGDAA